MSKTKTGSNRSIFDMGMAGGIKKATDDNMERIRRTNEHLFKSNNAGNVQNAAAVVKTETPTAETDTSLLGQAKKTTEKWGGDIFNYDIQGAIQGYDSNLAKYNNPATSQEEKAAINAIYGGDITTWDNKNAYTQYMNDYNEVTYVNSLKDALTAKMEAAEEAERKKVQYADTRRMLMEKYLPDTLQAQGLANTGYVADTLLRMENNYNQYALGAMNERAQTEQDAMKEYQTSLQAYKQQQAQTAYEKFLLDEENKQTTKNTLMESIYAGADLDYIMTQAKDAGLSDKDIADLTTQHNKILANNQAELKTVYIDAIRNMSDTEQSYVMEDMRQDIEEGNLAKDDFDELMQQLASKVGGSAEQFKYNNKWYTYDSTEGTVSEYQSKFGALAGDGFYESNDGKLSRTLIATSANGNEKFRVDPNFRKFIWAEGDKAEVEFNGEDYSVKVGSLTLEEDVPFFKELLGLSTNEDLIPQTVFMYQDNIYIVSDLKHSRSGEYQIYKLTNTDDLVADIKAVRG